MLSTFDVLKNPEVNLHPVKSPVIVLIPCAKLFCPPVQFFNTAGGCISPLGAKLSIPAVQFSRIPPSIS